MAATTNKAKAEMRLGKGTLVTLVVFGCLAAVLVLSSLDLSTHSCEVCMEYHGRSQCRPVSAETIDEARRAAVTNACAFIASGVTETMACQQLPAGSESCR